MSRSGMVWRCRVVLLGLAVATSAAGAQEPATETTAELRLQEIRRAFWALARAILEAESAGPNAATDARIHVVPSLCREFLLDFPDSPEAVRVRWLLGRAWALALGDSARAVEAFEDALIAYLSKHGPGDTPLAVQFAPLGIVTPRSEGDWQATTGDVDGDGSPEVVLAYRFAGIRAQLGGFCSVLRLSGGEWTAQRLFGPGASLASSMADLPMAPRAHQLRDLDGNGGQEILLHCRAVGEQQGLLLAFGIREGKMQRLLWANCPDGEYQVTSPNDGWAQIIILRRIATPEDALASAVRRERHYFGFDGSRYAFLDTRRDPAEYLYEQFWDGRQIYDTGNFGRAAQVLNAAATDDSLKTRPGATGSETDERDSYRATARYLAGLAYAHVEEPQAARRAMADVIGQYTYTKGVSAYGADFLPGYWAKRFSDRYRTSADLYAALAQVAPAYALWLYLTDHAADEPAAAILNAGVRTKQALVTDVTGDGRADIVVVVPAAEGPKRIVVVFVRTEKGWRGHAVVGDSEVRAEEDRGMPKGAIFVSGLSESTASRSDAASGEWVVGQVADFDGDGVKDIELVGTEMIRITWSQRGFVLVGEDEPPDEERAEPATSDDDRHESDLASLEQIEDAIYDRRKFESALTWLDSLEGRLLKWEDPERARAFLAEVAYHRALCYARLGDWRQAARSYRWVTERYASLAWAAPAKARTDALPSQSEQVR